MTAQDLLAILNGCQITGGGAGMKWMSPLWGLLAGLLSLNAVGVPLQQQLIVAFSEAPPWKILSPQQEFTGIDMDILQLLASKHGLLLVIKPAPLARCLEMLKFGDADIVSNLMRTPDRERYIQYLEVPYQTRTDKVFYLQAGNPRQIQSYDELYGLSIGVKRGAKYGSRFDGDSRLYKESAVSGLMNLKKLAAGRIDAVISTESEGDYLIKSLNWQGKFKKATLRFDEPRDVYFGLSRQSKLLSLAGSFEADLRQLLQSGQLEQIKARYQ